MAASNYITAKAQTALRDFLQTKTFADIPSDQIYKGIEHPTVTPGQQPTRQLPCVECVCQNAEAVDEHFLNWLADCQVIVRTNCDDTTEDEHHDIASDVFNEITTDTLAADLSSTLANFRAFLVNFKGQSWEVVGRSWRSIIQFQVHCCGSDVV